MNSMPFFIIILPAITVITVGLLGSTRRIGFWLALILGIVLTPVGGGLGALISGPKTHKPPKQPRGTQSCPRQRARLPLRTGMFRPTNAAEPGASGSWTG